MPTNNGWNNQVLDANVTFNGGTMDIGTDATDNAIDIGTNASAGRTITIGNTTGTSGIVLDAGTDEIVASTDIQAPGISFDGGTNVLDFYETGSWTPDVNFGNANTGITYTTTNGSYTRIGNIAFVAFLITLSSKGTATGIASIKNIPFNASTSNNFFSSVYLTSVTFSADYIVITINTAGNDIRFNTITTASGSSNLSDTNFANNSSIRGNITYLVA